MSPRPFSRVGLLTVPLIHWVRHLLIVPALWVWGVLLLFAADFAGGGLGRVIEIVVFAPVFGWYFVEALVDPSVTASLQDDAWLAKLEEDFSGFLIRLTVVASLALWATSAVWRRVRGELEPIRRTPLQRLVRSSLRAAGLSALFFLTSVLLPNPATRTIGTAGHLFFATVIFVALLSTGLWVTVVGIGTDHLLSKAGGPREQP